MAVFFLSLYIAVIFIRPMDWWEPVIGWPMVTGTALLTLFGAFTAFPKVMNEHIRFTQIPEAIIAPFLLLGVCFSWIHPFWGTGIIDAFTDFSKIILFFVVIILLGRHPRNFRILMWVMLVCVLWMVLHGILQIHRGYGFAGDPPLWRTDHEVFQIRYFGIFKDPNDLCLVFVIAIPLFIAEFQATSNLIFKIVCAGCIAMVAYGAWLTNSRGGWVALFGMAIGYGIAHTKGVWRWLIAVSSVLLLTVVAPARASYTGSVDFGRVNAWGNGIDAFKNYPIFGVGYKNFLSISDNVAAHNSYINVLTELGLIGYIPWLTLILLTMIHLRRTQSFKDFVERRNYAYLTGLYSALCGYLTGIYFLSRSYNPVHFILLGLTICQIVISCYDHNLYPQVFGNWRKDLRKCIMWCLLSIPLMWMTIRIANKIGGR